MNNSVKLTLLFICNLFIANTTLVAMHAKEKDRYEKSTEKQECPAHQRIPTPKNPMASLYGSEYSVFDDGEVSFDELTTDEDEPLPFDKAIALCEKHERALHQLENQPAINFCRLVAQALLKMNQYHTGPSHQLCVRGTPLSTLQEDGSPQQEMIIKSIAKDIRTILNHIAILSNNPYDKIGVYNSACHCIIQSYAYLQKTISYYLHHTQNTPIRVIDLWELFLTACTISIQESVNEYFSSANWKDMQIVNGYLPRQIHRQTKTMLMLLGERKIELSDDQLQQTASQLLIDASLPQ